MKNTIKTLLLLLLQLTSVAYAGSAGGPPYLPRAVAITGGTVNNTSIGATTPSTGAFTTLMVDYGGVMSGVVSNNGLINASPIGATTPSTGAFTTLTSSGLITNNGGGLFLNGGGNIKYTNGALLSLTPPTISSGFGTSPTIGGNYSTASFYVTVGTGGTASSGVIGFPGGLVNRWVCKVDSLFFTANTQTKMTATVANAVTVTNYTVSTGAAVAWPVGTVLYFACLGI